MKPDLVDRLLGQWRVQRPDLDHAPLAVIGRINLASHLLGPELERTFAAYGVSSGGFDVLAALRRSGPPFLLSPTALFNQMLLSSGAMTHRLDRLEAAGLVERRPDPGDRRGLLVALTPQGRTLADAAIADHLANEERLLGALDGAEREQLAGLLRKLVRSLSGQAGHPAQETDLPAPRE